MGLNCPPIVHQFYLKIINLGGVMLYMKVLKTLFLSLFVFALNSCQDLEMLLESTAANQQRFDTMSERSLCMGYLTFPANNIYHSLRIKAIKGRGVNCSPYADEARAIVASDAAVMRLLINLNQAVGNLPNSSSGYSSGYNSLSGSYSHDTVSGTIRTCYYNTSSGMITKSVGSAEICPLTY